MPIWLLAATIYVFYVDFSCKTVLSAVILF